MWLHQVQFDELIDFSRWILNSYGTEDKEYSCSQEIWTAYKASESVPCDPLIHMEF